MLRLPLAELWISLELIVASVVLVGVPFELEVPGTSTAIEDMDSVGVSATVARRDAGNEPPGMGSRRVAETPTESMSDTKP